MTSASNRQNGRNWTRIAATAVLGTTAALALSATLTYGLLLVEGLTPFGRSLVASLVVPIAVAIPLCLYAAMQADTAARFRRQLTRAATFDRTTQSYNGPVFIAAVERRARTVAADGTQTGAFLIVEAQQLRDIRRQYGLAWSEEALRAIASAIRASVRSGDLVGRLDADEFGVFLPGATEQDAHAIGDRITAAVSKVFHGPKGAEIALDVRIGGVICETDVDFDEMFRSAAAEIENARAAGSTGMALATTAGRA